MSTDDASSRTRALISRLIDNPDVDLVQLFTPERIVVVVGDVDAGEPQSQLVASMLVNLLSRLYPVVQRLELRTPSNPVTALSMPRWHANDLRGHLLRILEAGPNDVRYSHSSFGLSQADIVIQVGRGTREQMPAADLYVGSSGWEVYLHRDSPRDASGPQNPVGAYAAACMAAAEVWKELLARRDPFREKPIFPLSEPLIFSTFTYLTEEDQPNPPLRNEISLDSLTAIGVGAGGGATIYTLASGLQLTGRLYLVDPDEVEDSNLNRYVFAGRRDAERGAKKVHVLEDLLRPFPDLTVDPHPHPFGDVDQALDLEYVAAAVHSRSSRREIQYETPKVLWDAGATGDGVFQVWRLLFGKSECMWCKHPPDAEDPEEEATRQLSEFLGLSPDVWRRKIRDNEPFTPGQIAELQRDPAAKWELPAEGQRFGSWYQAQCGRMKLPELDEEIPVPFAPVMAGVLIAGEIIKEFHFPDSRLSSYYWNTLVGKFMRRKKPEFRSPRSDCRICQDRIYRDQYKRTWRLSLAP